MIKVVIGFEPMMKVLQTSALPLGYTTIKEMSGSNALTLIKGR